MPRQFNTDDLRKALDAYAEYSDDNEYDQNAAREALFDRALNEGFLDDYIREQIERDREWDDSYDPDADPDAYIDQSEIDQYAERLDASDFPDRIPFAPNLEIDPDLEEYNVYNFINENPKAREFFTNQTLDLRGTNASDRFLRAVRAGTFTPAQLRALNNVRFEGNSAVLENTTDEALANRAAEFVNRAATGRRDIPSFDPIYENAAEALNQIGDLNTVQRALANYDEDLDNTRRRLELFNLQRSSSLGSYIPSSRREGSQQLSLDFDLDPVSEQEARIASSLETLPTSFNTVQELTNARNRLNNIQRNLGSLISQRSSPAERASFGIASSVLPQVEAALGDRGLDRAIRNATQQSQLRTQAEERVIRENQEYFDLLRSQDPNSGRPNIRPTTIFDTPSVERYMGMDPIPGLNAELQRQAAEGVQRTVAQYPEVERLLTASVKESQRKPIRSEASKTYSPYLDTAQLVSLPEDRKAVYESLLNSDETYRNDRPRGLSFIKDIEAMYTSGNTEVQQKALDILDSVGYGDAMRSVSSPAISLSRPIVGGGRYVDTSGDEADVPALRERILNRAQDLGRAMAVPQDVLKDLYPNYFQSASKINRKLELDYDPSTNTVIPVEPGKQGAYGIEVSTGTPRLNPNLGATTLPNTISSNALRFLADNPILGLTSVSFTTKTPDEGYSYAAKELPLAVSDAFGRFAQSTALEGLPPGTLVSNSPYSSGDLLKQKRRAGLTEATSSTLRKLQPFLGGGQSLPNLRGAAYQTAGFGPTSQEGTQYAYIDAEGRVVPLQLGRPEAGLAGSVKADPGRNALEVRQARLPLTTKSYYSVPPEVIAAQGLKELARGVRQTPSALLPGAADLIPSPEAIQTGYREGPLAMGRQMAQEFAQGLPVSAAAAGVLSTPLAAPFAPGVGAGLVGTAAARALNEVVRQETGEGIVPKLRQAIGTAPRTGAASPQRAIPRPLTAQIRPLTSTQRAEMNRQQNRGELQRRIDLAKERFNPAKLEFGLSELLRGR